MAHALKPIVLIGQNGITEAVIAELDSALQHHELVKVKMAGADREAREQGLTKLASHTQATVVQRIGGTATLFRRNLKKPVISLSS